MQQARKGFSEGWLALSLGLGLFFVMTSFTIASWVLFHAPIRRELEGSGSSW